MSTEWKFKKELPENESDDFWYDLTKGGYLKPEDYLSKPMQIKKLYEAIEMVESFERALEEMGFLEC